MKHGRAVDAPSLLGPAENRILLRPAYGADCTGIVCVLPRRIVAQPVASRAIIACVAIDTAWDFYRSQSPDVEMPGLVCCWLVIVARPYSGPKSSYLGRGGRCKRNDRCL